MASRRIYYKLDKILANKAWVLAFLFANAFFDVAFISDQSSRIVSSDGKEQRRKVSYKFFNMWVDYEKFLSLVEKVWKRDIYGSPMFRLVIKLKILKGELRNLN